MHPYGKIYLSGHRRLRIGRVYIAHGPRDADPDLRVIGLHAGCRHRLRSLPGIDCILFYGLRRDSLQYFGLVAVCDESTFEDCRRALRVGDQRRDLTGRGALHGRDGVFPVDQELSESAIMFADFLFIVVHWNLPSGAYPACISLCRVLLLRIQSNFPSFFSSSALIAW